MPKPILCLDVDGTLVNSQRAIHPNDVRILAEGRHPTLVLATGRPLHSVRRVLSRHRLFEDRPLPYPLVLQNGSLLYRPGEALCLYRPFSEETQAGFLRQALAEPEITFFLFGQDELDLLHPSSYSLKMKERFELETQPLPSNGPYRRFSKFMLICEDPSTLRRFAGRLELPDVELSFSLPTVLEINPAGVNKGEGVRRLLDALGLDDALLFAAGDGGNDLPLFLLTEHSFASVESPAEIQQHAQVIVDYSEAGVLAPMLERIRQII